MIAKWLILFTVQWWIVAEVGGLIAIMSTLLNFETFIPLTDFETVTNIKCEDRREISSLTKSEKS